VQKTLRDFVVGALAGTFGTILNTPPDVAKSRIQNQDALLPPGNPFFSLLLL
jgi:solute carrier family 25 2-oxodicarboxylate transporter 21